MKTKKQLWNLICEELSLAQYKKCMGISKYDDLFKKVTSVSKSKKVQAFVEQGLVAPLVNRYSLAGIESNSFGDQIIRIYDRNKHETFTIVNQEGCHESPQAAVDYLNRNTLLNERIG